MIDILLPAFLLSVVLVGIHSYFGLEIIKKGIIFTDLAIGQMSALGAALSLLFLEGQYLYSISLLFALFTGFLIALITKKGKNIEAFIGLIYAFGLSAIFIVLSKSPHGTEEFQNLMASDILFTPTSEIVKTGIIYSLLGIFIYFFNKKTTGFIRDVLFVRFFRTTHFLLFVTFSLTVTSSVKIAGVLVVFALLISPALISMSLFKKNQIIFSWVIGVIINVIAIFISYKFDLPTGYTLVMLHAFLAALIFAVMPNKSPN